jgi:myo-inositol 2-dehydrogenase / D-chiro-inositol 1-dehydrogenase
MTIRLALIGAGRIGRVHAKAISTITDAKLVAVADAFEGQSRQIVDIFGGEIRSIDAIAKASDVDAVLICTPTNTHANLIEKFSYAGKAIFCEKPIDLNIGRVRRCVDVVTKTNTTLMVGFNRRYDPHFGALKQSVDSGNIGVVEMINIISRDPGAPPPEYIKSSGGIFKDMTIHDFDMARFLLGEEIETVMARASVLVDEKIGELGDFDSANIILTTKSGKQCAISNSRRATYGYDQRVEVHGSKGMVLAENQRPVGIEIATEDGYQKPPLYDFFMTRYLDAYAAEISAFLVCLAEGTKPEPSGADGLAALILAEAALTSVTDNRGVAISEFD